MAVANCNRAHRQLFILDGHDSHKILAAIDFCRGNKITLLSLPAHASHHMQPLDRTFFRSVKAGYLKAVSNWLLANRSNRLTQYDIVQIFGTVYNRAATVESAAKIL